MAFASRSLDHLRPDYRQRARARLLSFRTDGDGGCWLFNGCRFRQGYGKLMLGTRPERAHVAAWLLFRGDIPANIDVCHRCNVHACFNPNYLYLGTRSENVQHAVRDGLSKHHGHGPRFTADQVREIRARHAGGERASDIARAFRVDHGIVGRIVHRQAFRWVDARA